MAVTLFFLNFFFSVPKRQENEGPVWEQSRQDRRDRPGDLHRREKWTYVRRPGNEHSSTEKEKRGGGD